MGFTETRRTFTSTRLSARSSQAPRGSRQRARFPLQCPAHRTPAGIASKHSPIILYHQPNLSRRLYIETLYTSGGPLSSDPISHLGLQAPLGCLPPGASFSGSLYVPSCPATNKALILHKISLSSFYSQRKKEVKSNLPARFHHRWQAQGCPDLASAHSRRPDLATAVRGREGDCHGNVAAGAAAGSQPAHNPASRSSPNGSGDDRPRRPGRPATACARSPESGSAGGQSLPLCRSPGVFLADAAVHSTVTLFARFLG